MDAAYYGLLGASAAVLILARLAYSLWGTFLEYLK